MSAFTKLQNCYAMITNAIQLRPLWCVCLVFLLVCAPVQAEESPRWYFLDDPASQLEPESAWAVLKPIMESEPDITDLSRGFTKATSWLATRPPRIDGPLYLHIKPGYLNQLEVFAIHNGELHAIFSSNGRDNLSPNFTIEIPSQNEPVDAVLVRLNTTSAHILVAQWLNEDDLDDYRQISGMQIGAYVAAIGVLALVFIALGLRLKEWMHVVYSLYLIAVAIITVYQHGYVAWLPLREWGVSSHIVGVAVGLSFSLMAWFFKLFFAIDKQQHLKSSLLVNIVIGVGVVTAAVAWTSSYVNIAPMTYLFGYLLTGNAVYLAFISSQKEGEVEGRIFLLAFAQSCVAVVVTTATLNQWIPMSDIGFYAYSVSVILQALLLLVGFVERLIFAENKALDAADAAEFKAVTIAGEMTKEVFEASEKLQASLKRERELRQSHEHFINTVNHEYRTPLAIIKGNVEMIKLRFPEAESLSEKVDRAMQRLQQLFDQTLRGYREMNTDQLSMEKVDVADFVKDVVASSLISTRVDAIYPHVPVIIQTDTNLLRTSILNLLDNADKYCYPRDGSAVIDLSISEDEHLVNIRIANDYDPDSEKPSSSLFQPYVRGTKQTGVSGLGFGLYLVKSNIEKVGGKIRLLPSQSNKFAVLIVLPRS